MSYRTAKPLNIRQVNSLGNLKKYTSIGDISALYRGSDWEASIRNQFDSQAAPVHIPRCTAEEMIARLAERYENNSGKDDIIYLAPIAKTIKVGSDGRPVRPLPDKRRKLEERALSREID